MPYAALKRLPAVLPAVLDTNSAKRRRSSIFWILPVGQSPRASTKTMSSASIIWPFALEMRFNRLRRHCRARSEHDDKQRPLLPFYGILFSLAYTQIVGGD